MNWFLCGLIPIFGSCLLAIKMPLFFMIGSWTTFFSAVSAIGPLAGYFGGVFGSAGYLIVRITWRLLFASAPFGITCLINTVPGWCATAFWIVPAVVGSVFVPLSAIVLFVMHPVGAQAYMYALLWLVPIGIYCLRSVNISFAHTFFAQALCATFVAHAVGSVLWLYGMPAMHPESWVLLAPLALAERLFFAAGMTVARTVIVHTVAWAMQRRSFQATPVQVIR